MELLTQLKKEIQKRIIGQDELIEKLLIAFFSEGHLLLEGVPGLAKSLLASTTAEVLGLDFRRVQFTPDMLPSDLLGGEIYLPQEQRFSLKKGPIFTHILLADEINRAPAKVQSALLECMQERQVSLGGTTFPLPPPFWVIATQNPIEQEGTYALPEAQMDRFLMRIFVTYPTQEEETQIMRVMSASLGHKAQLPKLTPLMPKEKILQIQKATTTVDVPKPVEAYIIRLVRATRKPEGKLKKWQSYIQYGASPRASMSLYRAAQTLAYLRGRNTVYPEDVKMLAADVLNHRIILSYQALAENVSSLSYVETLLQEIPI
ncbi:MAG: AAA family ATPase [Bacteroidia bacterium]